VFFDFVQYEENGIFIILFEYFKCISLETFLEKTPTLNIDEKLLIFQQIYDCLNYLHKHSIVHRDINLTNILIDPENLQIKIIDYGLARQKVDLNCLEIDDLEGSYDFRPPKTKIFQNPYLTDLWSAGLVFLSLFWRKKVTTRHILKTLKNEEDNLEATKTFPIFLILENMKAFLSPRNQDVVISKNFIQEFLL